MSYKSFKRPARRGQSRRSALSVAAVSFLSILVLGVCLGVGYAMTPLHAWLNPRGPRIGGESAFLAPEATAAQKVGADTQSVVAPTKAAPTPAPLPTAPEQDDQFAFLLMGFGGGGHDGADLTDSMMVVVVDPGRKTLTLLSIPRDSWVPMSLDGKTTEYNKINTAYAFAEDPTLYPDRLPRYDGAQGAGNFAMDTVSRILGIPIKYYLALDFEGFRQMIDVVGGVDVNVPDSFSARYPKNDDPSVDASWTTVRFAKGPEHMNGERAIEFARAREAIDNLDEGTDFARSRRQRLIMEAFKARLFEPTGMVHLPQLLAIASQHVDTNYTVPGAAQLTAFVLGWKDVKFYQTALTDSNFLDDATGPDGTFVLVPSAPDRSWGAIQAYVRRLWDNPAAAVAIDGATIVAENGTGVPGTAGRVSDDLLKLGYRVADPTLVPRRSTTMLVDKSGGKLGPVVDQLRQDLGLPDLEVQKDASDPMNVLILELGVDEAGLTLSVPADESAPRSDVGVANPTSPVPAESSAPPTTAPHPVLIPIRSPTPVEGHPAASTYVHPTPPASPRPATPTSIHPTPPAAPRLASPTQQRLAPPIQEHPAVSSPPPARPTPPRPPAYPSSTVLGARSPTPRPS